MRPVSQQLEIRVARRSIHILRKGSLGLFRNDPPGSPRWTLSRDQGLEHGAPGSAQCPFKLFRRSISLPAEQRRIRLRPADAKCLSFMAEHAGSPVELGTRSRTESHRCLTLRTLESLPPLGDFPKPTPCE